MIIATATPKGGDGKSTTCYFVGNALLRKGFKVLFVDMDPQNSLTYLLFEHYNKSYDSADCDVAKFLVDPLRNKPYNLDTNLDVIPSTFSLASQRTIGKNVLKSKLESIKNNYDFIIIDTAPSYDNFFVTTCNASDIVIYPIFIKSILSLKTFIITVNLMLEEGNVDLLEKTKLLCTKYYNTENELQNIQVLRDHFKDDDDSLFYKTKIPFSKKIINVQNSNKLSGKFSDEVIDLHNRLIDEIFMEHKLLLNTIVKNNVNVNNKDEHSRNEHSIHDYHDVDKMIRSSYPLPNHEDLIHPNIHPDINIRHHEDDDEDFDSDDTSNDVN